MSGLHHWRGRETPGAGALLITGLALSYLVLPLVHHLVATPPGFRYISTAGNFFAFKPAVQALGVGWRPQWRGASWPFGAAQPPPSSYSTVTLLAKFLG